MPEIPDEILTRIFGAAVPDEFAADLARKSRRDRFESGNFLALEEDRCAYLPVVLHGIIRVYKTGESGREITLYRIEPGESCILTANCILNDRGFPALAEVETATEVLLIPAADFADWMDRYKFWRDYIHAIIDRRITSVLTTMSEVAFARIDARITEYLLKSTAGGSTLSVTHQEIANELGTAREVVSRILKEFERRALIRLSRGSIEITDPSGLRSYLEA